MLNRKNLDEFAEANIALSEVSHQYMEAQELMRRQESFVKGLDGAERSAPSREAVKLVRSQRNEATKHLK